MPGGFLASGRLWFRELAQKRMPQHVGRLYFSSFDNRPFAWAAIRWMIAALHGRESRLPVRVINGRGRILARLQPVIEDLARVPMQWHELPTAPPLTCTRAKPFLLNWSRSAQLLSLKGLQKGLDHRYKPFLWPVMFVEVLIKERKRCKSRRLRWLENGQPLPPPGKGRRDPPGCFLPVQCVLKRYEMSSFSKPGRCQFHAVVFGAVSDMMAISIGQTIHLIRSKDSIGRAQPHESGYEKDAHG